MLMLVVDFSSNSALRETTKILRNDGSTYLSAVGIKQGIG
jgi:hypothetical protein